MKNSLPSAEGHLIGTFRRASRVKGGLTGASTLLLRNAFDRHTLTQRIRDVDRSESVEQIKVQTKGASYELEKDRRHNVIHLLDPYLRVQQPAGIR